MQSPLHQHSGPAQRNRLVYLRGNFIDCAHVRIRRARASIKSAERADNIADVRIVDVPVDNVGDDVVGMPPTANFVSRSADPSDIVRLEQRGAVSRRQSLAGERAIQNRLNVSSFRHLPANNRLHYPIINEPFSNRVSDRSICVSRPG